MSEGCAGCENCDCKNNQGKIVLGTNNSLWEKTVTMPRFTKLAGDVSVDTVIIGGGITGLTTAYLLQKAGQKVAVVEAAKIGMGVTGYTTAHITEQLDIFFTDLIKQFGKKRARLVADSSREAIGLIERITRELTIADDFERVPGYLYTESEKDIDFLHKELEAAKSLGVEGEYVTDVPLPFPVKGALQFNGQAQFHPLKYLAALAKHITERGGMIFEDTRVTNVRGGQVITGEGVLTGKDVVMATHTPILSRLLPVQGKLSPKRSYVLSTRLPNEGSVGNGLFWETKRPYHYARTYRAPEGQVLVVGGEDHTTGEVSDTKERFERLAKYACKKFGVEKIDYQWSAQLFESADDLPYIGRAPFARHLWVATGFSGTGMTFGTVSALMLSDLILGKGHVWEKLYKPSRISLSSFAQLMKFGMANAKHVVIDRFKRAQKGSGDDLAFGEGRVMSVNGKNAAVYKNKEGKVTTLSPICTHAGCVVNWNNAEGTWDCPCHGSRFSGEGKVIVGPAVKDLQAL